MMLETKLEKIEERYNELTKMLADESVLTDQKKLQKVAKEHSQISEITEKYNDYKKVKKSIEDDREILETEDDPELIEMAKMELEELEAKEDSLISELNSMLIPKDPLEDKDTIVEIRAGTGGKEAALFAADLLRMYSRYAEEQGWKVELIDSRATGIGGFKEVIFMVHGDNAYGKLRFESGVHRVQRVPETEASGRVHTSAATVAVLPEAEEVDIEIKPEELKIDVFRSSGPGGQSVNTTDSAVRVTHVPTGLVVQCQDEKSQLKNKNKALKVLRARLLDMKIQKKEAERAKDRRLQIGTGDRSAKIRTYNFPQNRVTDHRIGLTLYKLTGILNGDLDEVIDALRFADREEKIAS